MKFKGTIIITDPCYVVKKCLDENPYPFPWTSDLIDSPNIDELIAQYTKWKEEHDDWDKCDCGQKMEALGINTYFTENTIYGDWGCGTYKVDEDPYKLIDRLIETSDEYKCLKIGSFCADSGQVSVFLLDEVRKYNPDIDKWIEKHDQCVTTIPNFNGEVNYYVDKNGEAHIVGIGNINFLTAQIDL